LLQNVKNQALSKTKRYFDCTDIGIVSEILVVYSQFGGCKQPPNIYMLLSNCLGGIFKYPRKPNHAAKGIAVVAISMAEIANVRLN
jgi:hypothetical protein